jgi:hypothetical protein
MFYLFSSNALFTYGITYFYEKNKPGPSKMITPKVHGGVTPLAFLFSFLALRPSHNLFKTKMFPYFIIPITLLMYEINEY